MAVPAKKSLWVRFKNEVNHYVSGFKLLYLDVKVSSKALPPGVSMREFAGIATLAVGETRNADIGINFNDTTQAAKFTISAGSRTHQVCGTNAGNVKKMTYQVIIPNRTGNFNPKRG